LILSQYSHYGWSDFPGAGHLSGERALKMEVEKFAVDPAALKA
jgi:hypothetical protein